MATRLHKTVAEIGEMSSAEFTDWQGLMRLEAHEAEQQRQRQRQNRG